MDSDGLPSFLGSYRILQRLGEGAAGVVYLATPTDDRAFARRGELLALKSYKDKILGLPGQTERIKREFEAGSTLSHANIVSIKERGVDQEKRPFIVMEYVDGQTLSDWVAMYHPLSDSVLVEVACQILEGIIELHAIGIWHRDLKPANIMLGEAFCPKVMDLGVILPPAKDREKLTPTDQFVGTIRNSSPELLVAKSPGSYDHRTDLYSYGTILYFLLHGYEVFASEDQFARLVHCVLNESPIFNNGLCEESPVKAGMMDICKRLLSKQPSDRFASAEEMRAAVAQHRQATLVYKPICAYMAAALTGLSVRDREGITFLGHSMAKTCKEHQVYAHQPRKKTDPVLNPDISPERVYSLDRKRLLASDLLIAICNEPSFGMGQELEIAANYGIPAVLVKREGIVLSRMVTGSFLNVLDEIEYRSPEDLEAKLKRTLQTYLEQLRIRRSVVDKENAAAVSQRIQDLRNSRGWPVQEAARQYGISKRFLSLIENSSDYFHNVGLVILKRIAHVHGMTLGELLSGVRVSDLKGAIQEDSTLQVIEQVALAEEWPVKDLVEIRETYKLESLAAAAKGKNVKLAERDIHNRHVALEARRLEKSRPRLF